MAMSDEAKKVRREYMREWRNRPENKKRMREYQTKWRNKNKDKVREYNRKYWQKKAKEKEVTS